MKHKILFVDDDESILLSISRVLNSDKYEIITSLSGKKALELLKQESVSVIISDMLMPEMNGVEFLEKSIALCPEAIRVVLSGNAELELITESINKGNIWHYIPKPWHPSNLKITLNNAIDVYETRSNEKKLIRDLEIKTELLQSLNDHLEDLIEQRTWVIHKRTELLNDLLEGVDTEEIIQKACIVISQILHGKSVLVKSSYLKKVISNPPKEVLDEKLLNISKKCQDSNTNFISPDGIGLVLHKREAFLGTLLFYGNIGNDKEIGEVEDFVSVISFAISQKKIIDRTPDILKSIDSLIKDI